MKARPGVVLFVALALAFFVAVALYAPEGEGEGAGERDMDRLEEFLRNFEPAAIDEMRELKKEHPDMYERFVRERFGWMRKMEELKKQDPVRYELTLTDHKLERRMDELADSYRKADAGGAKDEIRKELRGVIADRIDVKIRLKAHEVELMKEEFERQEGVLNSWKEEKESFIERKLRELTGGLEKEAPF